MSARIFITGGAGFIGSYLARQLAQSGVDVCVFDNFHPQAHAGNPANVARLEGQGIRIIRGDIRDYQALSTALAAHQPDIVYHLAAETGTGQSFDLPVQYTDVNVAGTARLIEAIRESAPKVARVILAGSRAIYGEGACVDAEGRLAPAVARLTPDMARGDFDPKDKAGRRLKPVTTNTDCPPAPTSVYASGKLMQEYLLTQGFWGTRTKVGILRLQNVYGPGQSLNNPYTGVLSIFARQIGDGKALDIYEDGAITRDFILIDDVVSAFIRMGQIEHMPVEILDIGSGQGETILEVARCLLGLLSANPDRLRITGHFRAGDIRHAVADISRATELLDWRPKYSLNTGLARLVAWTNHTSRVHDLQNSMVGSEESRELFEND